MSTICYFYHFHKLLEYGYPRRLLCTDHARGYTIVGYSACTDHVRGYTIGFSAHTTREAIPSSIALTFRTRCEANPCRQSNQWVTLPARITCEAIPSVILPAETTCEATSQASPSQQPNHANCTLLRFRRPNGSN